MKYSWLYRGWPPPVGKLRRRTDGELSGFYKQFANGYCATLRNLRIRHHVPYPEGYPNGATVREVYFVLHPRHPLPEEDLQKYFDSLQLVSRRANFHLNGGDPDILVSFGDVLDEQQTYVETILVWE